MKHIRRCAEDFIARVKEARRQNAAPLIDTASDRFFNKLEPTTYARTVERLKVGRGFFSDEAYLRQQVRADWQQTDPRIQRFAGRLIEAFRRNGIPFYVHGAFRTREEQHRLFREKRTKAIWPRAAHCQGVAVDIVHSIHHWDLTEQEWAWVGKIGKDLADRMEIPIQWGGDWSFYDPAHWEVKGWKENVRYTEAGEPLRRTARVLLRQ